MAKTGVLLMGFGGPDSLEAVGPFMCNLMGRQPSDELVTRVCARYEAIGGASPLTEIAGRIARALEEELNGSGHDVVVRVGMRYWEPFIVDAFAELKDAGCEKVVGVSLSPFESKVSSGAYRQGVMEAMEAVGELEYVESPIAGTLQEFVDFHAAACADELRGAAGERLVVAFTAHSLPESDLVDDDPYVAGLKAVASAIADKLGFAEGAERAGGDLMPGFESFGTSSGDTAWFLAYQSKGARPGAWLGPDVDDLIEKAPAAGFARVIVCPIGFVTDHMETLYDLDIVAAGQAAEAGVGFARSRVPNDDPTVVHAMARAIAQMI